MPRTPRPSLPDGPFHVVAHAVSGEMLFCDDGDRGLYLDLLRTSVEESGWKVLTFALMPNHVHLLVQCSATVLSAAMWRLHGTYARRFNVRYERRGHLFDGRFKARPVTDDRYLIAVARYIALNPVKAKLVADPAEYRWSAHRAIIGLAPAMPPLDVDALLSHWGHDRDMARLNYRLLVEEGAWHLSEG